MPALVRAGERVRLGRGEALRAHYAERASCIVVECGALSVSCQVDAQRRQILAFGYAGEALETSRFAHFLDLAFTACAPLSLIAFSSSRLERLGEQEPQAKAALCAAVRLLERRQSILAISVGRLDVEERVATLLMELALAAGVEDAGGSIEIPVSRADMADYLGLNPDTVSRVLSRLLPALGATISGRHLTLASLAALAGATPLAPALTRAYREV